MLVVGLTGGIATGKSTVSALLSQRHHIPIIDADLIARDVVSPSSSTRCLQKLVRAFGDDILLPDGSLDRAKLGEIIFKDEGKRKTLNGIVHPAVRWEMFKRVVGYWMRGEKMVVLDVPLLIEGGVWRWVGSEEIQLTRLLTRDPTLPPSSARHRLTSQLPIAQKVPYADIVLDNSGSRSELEEQVDLMVQRLEREAGRWWWRVSWVLPPVGVLSALGVVVWRWVRWVWREGRRRRREGRGKKE
ncbi:hypothetical protein CVT26_009443 [Gymnopilus dilepis]|uniref:Dephospho-CoA kinase n=1 Tax=Gymnopilus dilepis TaxID=231916 RepID=A0A409YIB4_9AGAR|nr:hypothetical protein CVT26_009443 [Gymnopilus dilepis]